jgi:hypothetical protein
LPEEFEFMPPEDLDSRFEYVQSFHSSDPSNNILGMMKNDQLEKLLM